MLFLNPPCEAAKKGKRRQCESMRGKKVLPVSSSEKRKGDSATNHKLPSVVC